MCLAVPGRILCVEGTDPLLRSGRVDFAGVVKDVNLAFVPDAAIGDYVLVHVGIALQVIDEAEARQVFEYLTVMGEVGELAEVKS